MLPSKPTEIVVFGAGGHARSVADVLLTRWPEVTLIFVDESARPNETILGFAVRRDLPAAWSHFFVASGDNTKRLELMEQYGDDHKIVSAISPTAHLAHRAELGEGVFIGHGAYIGPLVQVGRGAVINTQAIADHEVKLGEGCQIAPNVAIGGRVRLGRNVFVGIGASIVDNVSVCADAVIGAGAVVIKDIVEPGTYVGVPVRRV